MPLTSRQIMAKTPLGRRQAADYVRIMALKSKRSKAGTVILYAKTKSTSSSTGVPKVGPLNTYISTIEVLNTRGHVKTSCSCPDFMFTWEVTLHNKGAADIEYSNGEPSDARNPQQLPGCCKHLYALFSRLVEQGRL